MESFRWQDWDILRNCWRYTTPYSHLMLLQRLRKQSSYMAFWGLSLEGWWERLVFWGEMLRSDLLCASVWLTNSQILIKDKADFVSNKVVLFMEETLKSFFFITSFHNPKSCVIHLKLCVMHYASSILSVLIILTDCVSISIVHERRGSFEKCKQIKIHVSPHKRKIWSSKLVLESKIKNK